MDSTLNITFKLMKSIILLTFVAVTSLSLALGHQAIHAEFESRRVGGFTQDIQVSDESKLDGEHLKINQFIRNNVPEVAGLKLYSYKQQVVAGMRYCYTYGSAVQIGTQKV